MKSRTAFSLVHATKDIRDFDVDMMLRMGCDIIGSRVWLVREAIKRGATHLLFVDHDMYFPPDSIKKLMEQDKDIIGAPYNFRQFPLRSTAVPTDEEPINGEYRVDPETLPKETFKVKTLGTGFLLIKLSVFEKIPEPWFLFGRNKEGELVQGEDTFFCAQATKAGFEIWADPTLGVKHVGDYIY